MNSSMLRRALLPGATLLALGLVAACGADTADGGDTTPPPATATGEEAEYNQADVEFAQNMIVHHQQAVEMSELAAERAEDPELAELASDVMAAQEPEIATMTEWLTAWGQPVEPMGGHEGMAMPGMLPDHELAALAEASGAEFDRMFAELMIAHHDGAIEMAREVQEAGANPDVNVLATTIEQEQSAEVETLETILGRL